MPKLPTITERDFTRQVLQLAKLCGWRSAHFRPAQTQHGWRTAVSGDGVGFPDLILLRGHTLLAIELKVGSNTTSPEQTAWLVAFENAGIYACVWKPSDWDTIERALR